jgi:hypothetical protein
MPFEGIRGLVLGVCSLFGPSFSSLLKIRRRAALYQYHASGKILGLSIRAPMISSCQHHGRRPSTVALSPRTLMPLSIVMVLLTHSRRVLGALAAGQVSDYVGRRNTLIIALAISLTAVTMEVVATTSGVFFGGRLLNGVAVAAIEGVSGTYVAEVCQPCLLSTSC